MNNKGGILSIIVWLASVVVIILILAAFVFFFDVTTTALLDAGAIIDSSVVNLTDATQKTMVPINLGMRSLTWISFLLITVLAFGILVENFYIRQHPILFFVHILIIFLGIIAAISISNFYEIFLNDPLLGGTLSEFTAASFTALNLPYWVAVIGIIGLIFSILSITISVTSSEVSS
ncbi:hypothetical protein LCGC14_2770100 [marine sediment metagenome]|uniref:Uncharacterized protein n=1 Tax=marine sediment metagenome TaxID=412755 RepID=A0A0F8YWC9_9ZZZZ